MRFKVVLDANIFISRFLTANESIAKIFFAWQKKKIIVFTSYQINSEIYRAFQYPKIKKFLRKEDYLVLTYLLEQEAVIILAQKKVSLCQDSDDNKYLECSWEANADFLISGDKHLLKIKKFHQTKIITPLEFNSLI